MSGAFIPTDAEARLVAAGMTVAVHAARRPDDLALLTMTGRRSWRELNSRANQLARAFRRAGLEAGDAVALLAHNAPEFVETWAACLRAGLRLTPVNWHQSADIIGYIVDNCEARAFVASGRFPEVAGEAASRAPGLVLKLAFAGPIAGFRSYEDVVGGEDAGDIPDPEAGTTMLYTSGTTGRPKGVYRKTRPAVSQLTNTVLETAAFKPAVDRSLITGPLYHAAPLQLNLITPLNQGVACIVMDKWDAEETLRLVEAHRITHTHVVPTMLHRLLQLPEEVRRKYDHSSLRWVMHGAAPCPVHVKQAAMDWLGPVLYEYYSATEGGGVFIRPEEWLRKPGSVGRPVTGVEIALFDDAGAPVPQGVEGTVYMKAPPVGRFEYFKDAEKTNSTYRGDYYTLGDMGKLDEDGYLFLTGRSAELIISGGVNIYPVEIDAVLLQAPGVADAAAVGVPHEDWGEEVKAVVELKPGVAAGEAAAAAILAYCQDRLPGFQRPRSVDFVERLPRSEAGKVLRKDVRARYWAGRTRAI